MKAKFLKLPNHAATIYTLIYLRNIWLLSYTLQSCCLPSKMRAAQSHQQPREAITFAPYVAIQGKVNYRAEGKHYSANLKIHIHRNNRIWVSITHSWGGELCRCNITAAGIGVINYIDRSYQSYDYAQLQEYWRVPCGYDLIQAMLLGQLPHIADLFEELSGGYQIIRQVHGNYVCTGTIDKRLKHLVNLSLVDSLLGHRWHIFYKYNHKRGYQQGLPSEVDASFELFHCNLKYQNIRFSIQPLSFPFNIPG